MSQDGARAGRWSWGILLLALGLAVALVIGVVAGILVYRAVKTSSLTEPDAVVFFGSVPGENQREAILDQIDSWPEVEGTEYVSETDRYQRLVDSLVDTRALNGMTGNPFASSVEIDLSSPLTALQIDDRLAGFASLRPSVTSVY